MNALSMRGIESASQEAEKEPVKACFIREIFSPKDFGCFVDDGDISRSVVFHVKNYFAQVIIKNK